MNMQERIIYITVATNRLPTAILGALAMAGFDRLMTLAENAYRWTRGIPEQPTDVDL